MSRAVLNRDFKLAKSLARTKEHWRLIRMAESQQAVPVSSAPAPVVITKDKSREDCASARNDFESTSRTKWRDKDLITTKKSIMYAACGVSEPVQQNRAIVVGNSYGYVQPSRWMAASYGPVVYHKPQHKQYKSHHSNHVKSGGGLSLNYKSKHFGLSAQSFGIQKHTDIRQQFR